MGVNHLGHFLLTLGLTASLQAGAPSRVVVVSSLTHANVNAFDWDDLLLAKPGAWSRGRAYAQSKLANVFFAYELNRRYSHCGVYANAIEPGTPPTLASWWECCFVTNMSTNVRERRLTVRAGLVASDILRNASNAFIRIVGTWILRIGGRTAAGAAYVAWHTECTLTQASQIHLCVRLV